MFPNYALEDYRGVIEVDGVGIGYQVSDTGWRGDTDVNNTSILKPQSNIWDSTQPFTFEFCGSIISNGYNQYFCTLIDTSGSNYHLTIALYTTDYPTYSGLSIGLGSPIGSVFCKRTGIPSDFQDNGTHHIAITFVGGDATDAANWNIYLDGTLLALSNSAVPGGTVVIDSVLGQSATNPLPGVCYYCNMYRRALTLSDAQLDYTLGIDLGGMIGVEDGNVMHFVDWTSAVGKNKTDISKVCGVLKATIKKINEI